MGRLLGVGPGRERVADAVADRHRVPALDHDPGAARHAEGLERLAGAGERDPRGARHLPGALGDPRARSTPSAPRRWACRSWSSSRVLVAGRSALVASRARDLRSEHRLESLLSREALFLLNNLVLVGAVLRDLLGDVLPAHLRGRDRHEGVGRAAVVRPLHGAAGARAGAAVRPRARSSPGGARRPRAAARPASSRSPPALRRAAVALLARAASSAARLRAAMFCVAAVRRWPPSRRSSGGRPRALSAISGHEPAPAALRARCCAATAAATAATRVHVGIAVLLVGVAASSAFQHARDVRLRPARARASAATTSATCGRRRRSPARRSRSGRCSSVTQARPSRRHAARPAAATTPRSTSRRWARIGRFFEGEATSEVGLRAGPAPRHLDGDAARPHAALTRDHRRPRTGASRTPTRRLGGRSIVTDDRRRATWPSRRPRSSGSSSRRW